MRAIAPTGKLVKSESAQPLEPPIGTTFPVTSPPPEYRIVRKSRLHW
jgi:hypothetical protein